MLNFSIVVCIRTVDSSSSSSSSMQLRCILHNKDSLDCSKCAHSNRTASFIGNARNSKLTHWSIVMSWMNVIVNMSRKKKQQNFFNKIKLQKCFSPNSHFIDWIKSIHLIRQRNSYQFASINRNSNNNNLRFDPMWSILCVCVCVNIFVRRNEEKTFFHL